MNLSDLLSILHEFGNEYFDNYQFTPFMRGFCPKKENLTLIPAVTHVESGRLQSVTIDLRP